MSVFCYEKTDGREDGDCAIKLNKNFRKMFVLIDGISTKSSIKCCYEKGVKSMINTNISILRKRDSLSQEQLAEKVGVSRQTIAKWEKGESVPDVIHCSKMAEVFEVTMDDLVNFNMSDSEDGFGPPPKGKFVFGVATVGERGQIVIPAKARRIFHIKQGDSLMVLGDIKQGLALVKTDIFIEAFKKAKEENGFCEE